MFNTASVLFELLYIVVLYMYIPFTLFVKNFNSYISLIK